jgi:hypothetical protein
MGREREDDAKPGDLPDQNIVSFLRGLRTGTAQAYGYLPVMLCYLIRGRLGIRDLFHVYAVRSILEERVLFYYSSRP